MNPQELIGYWKESAADAKQTAETLVENKRYHHALFFCHLALEKLLKGLVYKKTQHHPLPIHDLVKLAQEAGLSLSGEQTGQLAEITTWNVQARYDSVKREFYRKASPTFTKQWITIFQTLYLWLNAQY